ncbi:MAG TPA: carboxyl transferase domain-containing protein [Alphaproteobacteria bacterium]|nr:carboxyl transferase domain-containing protein [Alphaproteobacteria bacterium]
MAWDREIDELHHRRALARRQGGEEAVARQHEKGRLSLRERIDRLADAGSFRELGQGAGGSPNVAGLRKSVYTEQLACTYRVPLVRLHEGGGGSVTGAGGRKSKGASRGPVGESVAASPRFRSVAEAMATVPVATAALGPVAGLPAARLVAAHFSVMTKATSQVLVAGPAVVERALGVSIDKEELGGADVHTVNGVVDNAAEDEDDAFRQIRRFLSYLPANVWELPPRLACDDPAERREEALAGIVPRDRRKPYDMRRVIAAVFDRDSFFETGRRYGPGQITGYARLNGQAVGVLANDCRYYAGAMTADGAQKVRRFLETCDTFHLPMVSLVDEPGFMIGPESEKAGTIRYGTAAVAAAACYEAPWASVVVKKSYGVAAAAHYGPDAFVLAWPSAEMGALPVEGGVAVAFRREIAAAADPEARRQELEDELAARLSPFPRAESFAVHELIDPRETRPALCDWIDWIGPRLEALRGPRRFSIRP